MSTTRFDDMLHLVEPYVPFASKDQMVDALRQSAIEFCKETQVWVYEHDPITTLADISTYDLDCPCDGQVVRIMQAFFENCEMAPVSLDSVPKKFGYNWQTREGDPRYYLHDVPGEVIVVPRPTERTSNAITLRIAVAPTQTSDEIDTDVYNQWGETLAHGARARLHETPDQMYSDTAQADRNWALFNHGKGRAKIERNRSSTRMRPRLQPNYGFM